MLTIKNYVGRSSTFVLIALLCAMLAITGITVDATKHASTMAILLIIIMACLITAHLINEKCRKQLQNLHDADVDMELSISNRFESLKNPLSWFENVFTLLKKLPEEKAKKLKQLGNTLTEEWLIKAILLSINSKPALLSTGEVNILRECLDNRFRPLAKNIFETLISFDLNRKQTYTEAANIVREYYKLLGPFARTNELAAGMTDFLNRKKCTVEQKLQFGYELDQHLTPTIDMDKDIIHEIFSRMVKNVK